MKSFVKFVVIFALLGLATGCTSISTGYVGVKTRFGKVSNDVLEPGLHGLIPIIDRVTQLDTRLKSFEVQAQSSSKDLQVIDTVIAVQHSLTPAMATNSYSKIGDLEKFDVTVVAPAVLESLKAVTAHYTAEELVTKRDTVKAQIVQDIQAFIDETLKTKDLLGAIQVSNVSIKDFDFSREFNASIEAKVKAQQEALRAENEKQRRITEAEASAKEKELAADAEAYQLEKVSIQRAASIEREAKALSSNPLLLELRGIEKWDGKLPYYNGGGPIMPFMNLGGK